MALIKEGEAGENNTTYIDLKVVTGPTEEAPFFHTKTKTEAGQYIVADKFKAVEGKVKAVIQNPTPFKKDIIRGIQIVLEDEDGGIMISPTLTNGSKNLINTALGNIGKVIKCSPYLNKAGYPDVYCTDSEGERAGTKFKYNDPDLFDKMWEACESKAAITTEDIPF